MILELAMKNRSYRGYDESYRFTKEELMELVNVTRYAASSVNRQPFAYYIAWEKDEVDKIQKLTKWARGLPQMTLPHPGMCPTGWVIVLHNTDWAPNVERFRQDRGIVAQTLLLAAAEKGLGGCMIGNYVPDEVKAALDLPDNMVPVLIIALGKPAEKIVITEVGEDGDVNYYRDENDVHYVPKRKLEDIVLTRK
ncbi:MAG: nitroreductase family protein [Lachnospiraceae bacterium]|nr:nitroreductase family protein [Lachnospiraceae bacterium]